MEYVLMKWGLLPCLPREVISYANSMQFIEFTEVKFSVYMI